MGWGNESLFMDQMIKIFAMPTYGKNLLKIFFSGFETWYAALGNLALPNYLNGDHWLTLTYFKYEK